MISIADLNPYKLYIKIALIVAAIVGLFAAGVRVKSVFAERDALRVSEKAAVQTVKDMTEARDRELKLQEGITNAIKKIRVVSNNYIQSVEDGPTPVIPDGGRINLVAGGVPEALPSAPVMAAYSTSRIGAATPPR